MQGTTVQFTATRYKLREPPRAERNLYLVHTAYRTLVLLSIAIALMHHLLSKPYHVYHMRTAAAQCGCAIYRHGLGANKTRHLARAQSKAWSTTQAPAPLPAPTLGTHLGGRLLVGAGLEQLTHHLDVPSISGIAQRCPAILSVGNKWGPGQCCRPGGQLVGPLSRQVGPWGAVDAHTAACATPTSGMRTTHGQRAYGLPPDTNSFLPERILAVR